MKKVYLVSAKRSDIGAMLGTLKDVSLTKLGARMMLVVILLSLISLGGCALFSEDPVILDEEIPNLDDQIISYLLIRDLGCAENVTDIDYYYYSIDGNFSIKDGGLQYEPAVIEMSAGFDGEGLDKNSFSFYLIKDTSISIMGNFYPVKGDIDDLEYEFKYVDSSPYKFHKVVYIYSNAQLVGKVYYDSSRTVKENWIKEFLNNNLILMNVKRYSAEGSNNVESSREHIVSYLNVGNIISSKYCNKVINYTADVDGGLNVEFGSEYYSDIKTVVNIEFEGDESINYANITMQAVFYEFKSSLGVLKYEIIDSLEDNFSTVNIYNGDMVIGRINLFSEKEIASEWIESFLNENLIVTVIKSRSATI